MQKKATFTVRTTDETKKKLDEIADKMDRSRSWIINQAVASYVTEKNLEKKAIEKGLKSPLVNFDAKSFKKNVRKKKK